MPFLPQFHLLRLLVYWSLQLTGPIPASLSNCSLLTDLVLDMNLLTGTLPAQLGSLSHVRGLSLALAALISGPSSFARTRTPAVGDPLEKRGFFGLQHPTPLSLPGRRGNSFSRGKSALSQWRACVCMPPPPPAGVPRVRAQQAHGHGAGRAGATRPAPHLERRLQPTSGGRAAKALRLKLQNPLSALKAQNKKPTSSRFTPSLPPPPFSSLLVVPPSPPPPPSSLLLLLLPLFFLFFFLSRRARCPPSFATCRRSRTWF
jgi:hypothetical protein